MINERESRFMRIKRYSEDDIEQLHHREREAGKNWLEKGIQFMGQLDSRLGSYWEGGKAPEEIQREVFQFQACPVVRREFAKLDATDLDEVPAVHLADWAVFRGGYTPNFGKGSGANRAKLSEIPGMYKPQGKPLPYGAHED